MNSSESVSWQVKWYSKIIVDDAVRYHKIISEKTFRGLNRDVIIAALIYIACRVNNNPQPKEIAEVFNLDYTSATKGCKNAVTIINEVDMGKEQTKRRCSVKKQMHLLIVM